MKKQFRLLFAMTTLFMLVIILPASGQAPPPPTHGQNGNQTSPGTSTGCPLDRTDGIVIALMVSLAYAGFYLYRRGQSKKEIQ